MSQLVNPAPTSQSAPDYEALCDQQLAEMRRLNEQMDRRAQDSEIIKADIVRLKAERARTDAESQAILSRLLKAIA